MNFVLRDTTSVSEARQVFVASILFVVYGRGPPIVADQVMNLSSTRSTTTAWKIPHKCNINNEITNGAVKLL